MRRRVAVVKSLVLLLTLALAGAAWADPPKAIVEGSLARKSGQSVLLDARKSESDRPLKWALVSHPGLPLLTFDTAPRKNTYAFLPDPEDGTYIFSLVAVGKVGDDLEADVAVVQVVVGAPQPVPPGPGPTPPIPPGPTPPGPDAGFGLRAHVLTLVQSIPASSRKAGAEAIADAYRETVRLARDGKFATPQAVIADAATRVGAARPASWSSFTLAARLNELARAGRIATVVDVSAAFQEIANALQEVADGQ